MPRKCLRWMWLHRKLTICLVLVAGFVLLNAVAYNHAHSMTHFQPGGPRTARPELLSLSQKTQVLLLGVSVPRPFNHTDPGSQGLTFETVHLQGKDGISLEAWRVPHNNERGLVVLLHGYASCKSRLLSEAKAFHDLGYSTLLFDLRGSGGSDGNETTIGVDEADDLAAVVQSLQASGQPLILYGQSMGAAAILRAISQDGINPKAVIIECPFDRLLSTVENRFSAMGLPTFPAAPLLVFWGGVQHGYNGFSHNPVDYAKAVRCPVLQMHGETDHRVTTEQAKTIFDNLAGEKQFELFPEVGHQSYLKTRPETWKPLVAEFLRRHG